MLVREQRSHDADTDPVPHADADADPDRTEQDDRERVEQPRTGEHAVDAEPCRDGVEPLRAIDLEVEQ